MMLVDAGPLIALIHKDDAYHARCVQETLDVVLIVSPIKLN